MFIVCIQAHGKKTFRSQSIRTPPASAPVTIPLVPYNAEKSNTALMEKVNGRKSHSGTLVFHKQLAHVEKRQKMWVLLLPTHL